MRDVATHEEGRVLADLTRLLIGRSTRQYMSGMAGASSATATLLACLQIFTLLAPESKHRLRRRARPPPMPRRPQPARRLKCPPEPSQAIRACENGDNCTSKTQGSTETNPR